MKTAFPRTFEALKQAVREASLEAAGFRQKLRSCELSQCRATCCHDGAYMGQEEASVLRDVIQEQREQLASYGLELDDEAIEASGRSWKTATRPAKPEELAEDYPDHFPQTRCVFLDEQHRCGLQRLSVDLGLDPWHFKPVTCWMHPLNLSTDPKSRRPLLTVHSPESDPQNSPDYPGFASKTPCGRVQACGEAAHKTLRGELTQLESISGRPLLQELESLCGD